MTEETTAEATPETAAAEAPAKPVKAPRPTLNLTADGMEPLKVLKYPMPIKAPRFDLNINGEPRTAAQTAFGEKKYTYFEYGDCSFYVAGHLDQTLDYSIAFPPDYDMSPLAVDRQAQAAKAKAAKAAKASASPDSEGAAAPEEPVEAPAVEPTPESAPKKGKKAAR